MGLVLLLILCLVPNVFGTIEPIITSNDTTTSVKEKSQSNAKILTPMPNWVEDLRSKITCLLEEKGLTNSTPQIEKLVYDAERKQNVELRVEVSENGAMRINYKYEKQSASPALTPAPDPKWLYDFKKLVKDAILNQKGLSLDILIRQQIEYHDKNNNVIIENVDINDDGEAVITWKKKPIKV